MSRIGILCIWPQGWEWKLALTRTSKDLFWGFAFSTALVLLNNCWYVHIPPTSYPYIQILWNHTELLSNKLRKSSTWNNNPNVVQLKYALRQIIIKSSIETSQTGNCTAFDDSLFESIGLFDFQTKEDTTCATSPLNNLRQDNVHYYIFGFVRSLFR